MKKVSKENRPNHIPTPEEIKVACAKLQATWNERQEASRRVGYNNQPVMPHTIKVSELHET